MAFWMDEAGNIKLPAGDTGSLTITLEGGDWKAGDMAVFGIYDQETGRTLVRLQTPIVDRAATLRFENQTTREIQPGRYRWNLRLVTSPAYDEEGFVITDDSADNVYSIFNKMPKFDVLENGVNV